MKFRRLIKRTAEEIGATIRIAKVMPWREALNTFRAKIDIQKMVRNGYRESPTAKKRLLKKHATMIRYFEKTFGDFLSTYQLVVPAPESNSSDQTIWICWWQGLENAPDVVKACVESIRRNAGNHPIVIITEENYREYVDIPAWVEKKRKQGIISRTNFSDLLRFSLLAKHGGLWLDATFFCCGNLDSCFQGDVWSIKRPDYLHCSVACGMFAGYSLRCSYGARWIFAPMRDYFLHYWENNDRLIDYLLVDYMVVLAEKQYPAIANYFDQIPPNNPMCDELCNLLNQKYDEEQWRKLSETTILFKLTWKQNFSSYNTFFERVLSGELRRQNASNKDDGINI